MKNNSPFRFKIYAQNHDDTLIIKNNEEDNFFIQSVEDILANTQLIDDFSPKDRGIIEAIIANNNISTHENDATYAPFSSSSP